MTNEDIKKYVKDIHDWPKQGIIFKDISPILYNADVMKHITNEFANLSKDADVIVGPDARGFLFGTPLAMQLNKPFVMVRKPGKLPGEVDSISYDLEYGSNTLEIIKGMIKPGQKVVIVDDLLATGGTSEAIVKLIEKQGGIVLRSLFVIELAFLNGKENISSEVKSLIKY